MEPLEQSNFTRPGPLLNKENEKLTGEPHIESVSSEKKTRLKAFMDN